MDLFELGMKKLRTQMLYFVFKTMHFRPSFLEMPSFLIQKTQNPNGKIKISILELRKVIFVIKRYICFYISITNSNLFRMKTYFIVFLWAFAQLPTAFGQWYATRDEVTGKYYHIVDAEKNLQTARQNFLKIQKKVKNAPNEAFVSALYDLSISSKMMNFREDAENYLHWANRYAMDTLKKPDCQVHNQVLVELGRTYFGSGAFYIESFLHSDTIKGNFSAYEYMLVSQFYLYWGNYDKAKYYIEKHLAANPKLEHEDPISYAFKIKHLAWIETMIGNYSQANNIFQHAIKILEANWTETEYGWTYFLCDYMDFLHHTNDPQRLKNAIGQLISVIEGKETIQQMNRIGLACLYTNSYYMAEKMFVECFKLAETEEVNPNNIQCLYNNLAIVYQAMGRYEDAIKYQQLALLLMLKGGSAEEFVSLITKENVDIFFWFNNLAYDCIKVKKFDEALLNAKYAQSISEHFTSEYAKELRLSNIENLIKIYDAILEYSKLDSLIEILANQLITPIDNRRIQLYGSKRVQDRWIFNHHLLESILSKRYKHIKNSGVLLYDYSLLSKSSGLQVHLEELVKRSSSKDASIQQLYNQWQTLQKQIVNAVPNILSDSLYNKKDNLQRELSNRLKLRQDFFHRVHWQDVQRHLGSDSMAIEFIAVRDYNTYEDKCSDTILYYAVVLTATMSEPQIIPLFNEQQFLKLKEQGDAFYNSNQAYQLIWAKIEPFAKGMKHIFYTPAGELHNIIFPMLKTPQQDLLIDKHHWHLLTTTRILAQPNLKLEYLHQEPTLIAGDMAYETNATHLATTLMRGACDTLRGDTAYLHLSQSRVEVDTLQQICQRASCPAVLYSQKGATEANIKNLMNQISKPTVLIFSTHAFFNPRDPENNSLSPLVRCGLVLAGANQTMRTKKIFVDGDDGIWNGYEISESNLLDTKLVILSACETSKGEIQANEGIYGLHQAFKLAGAHYILASRKKVYDGDAKDFVVTFFRKASEGKMAIAEAFHQTQLEMKRNGRAWANWVLLK
jgi:CHAT domain-containing protein